MNVNIYLITIWMALSISNFTSIHPPSLSNLLFIAAFKNKSVCKQQESVKSSRFVLNDFVHLELAHGRVIALDDLAVRGHEFDLEPAGHTLSQLLNLPLPLLLVQKLATRLLVT